MKNEDGNIYYQKGLQNSTFITYRTPCLEL